MGDYTLVGLHFSLKKETPKEVVDVVSRKLNHEPLLPTDPEAVSNLSCCTSAYHQVNNFIQQERMYSEYYGEFECTRFNTIFQGKYGRGIHEFVAYIGPWIIVDEDNRGCIGWTLSEYCKNPTYLFVKTEIEDPKDKYIRDLENKCKELVERND